MKLSGQTALITGGARGIGQAISARLAQEGADVAFCDICPESEAHTTLHQIEEHGRQAAFYRTDISDRAAVIRMFDSVFERFGKLDILVNNAAINIRKPLVDLEPEDVKRVWDVCLWGVFHCTQLAARHMKDRGSGSIVMISSIHADRAFALSTSYNGAKAAVNQMAKTWAVELAPYRVRVNIIEPGWTDTPGERAFYTEQQLQEAGGQLPFGRLAQPSEIAASVAFLASEEASYVTGACLRVDGAVSLPRLS
jgi:glucose 1-dehydrogenase